MCLPHLGTCTIGSKGGVRGAGGGAWTIYINANHFVGFYVQMREFNGTADNAYILLRVFDLDDRRNAGVKFFRDPWSLYIDGLLDFRSDEGYKVYQ